MQMSEIDNYFIGDTDKKWRLTYDPSTILLYRLQSVIQLLPGFIILENVAGTIGVVTQADSIMHMKFRQVRPILERYIIQKTEKACK